MKAFDDPHDLCWTAERLGDAVEALAVHGGLSPAPGMRPTVAPELTRPSMQQWIDNVTLRLRIEAEPIELRHAAVPEDLRHRCPAILQLAHDGSDHFLCVLSSRRGYVDVLTPDHRVQTIRAGVVHAMLRARVERKQMAIPVERFLSNATGSAAQYSRARAAFLRRRIGHLVAVEGWWLRHSPGSDFGRQLRAAGILRWTAGFAGGQAGYYLAWVGSWWLLGKGVLSGSTDSGWFTAWLLLLASAVLMRTYSMRAQSFIVVTLGARLKRRLLDGALRLAPEETRTTGVGQFLGWAIESENVGALTLSGGFLSTTAVGEAVCAAIVMGTVGAGRLPAFVLIGFLMATSALAWRLWNRRSKWGDQRLQLTHQLIEAMVGYRTRLAQQSRRQWHTEEDRALAGYLAASSSMDRLTVLITTVPRLWLITGLSAILATLDISDLTLRTRLAISVGALLLGYGALSQFVNGLTGLIDAAVAWAQVKPLFAASSREDHAGSSLAVSTERSSEASAAVVLRASEISYRHQSRADSILHGCTFDVYARDRVLLQGASGSGKSTLASVIAGLRQPDQGLLLLRGLDYATLGGADWRKRVVIAPQFHENHVLAETLLFNLLMGRRWPPEPRDIRDARLVCSSLGLDPLITKMPSGLLQVVGDTGWQLSHGERSRLYVARALLQDADVVIFDESFAALDPVTLRTCLNTVMQHPRATIVIAHP